MSAKDEKIYSEMATAIVKLQAFMSPLFIWKMIWEEVLPRDFNKNEGIYKDRFKILTSTHGFANLLALWYISAELYQGIAPAKIIIQRQLALAPGVGKEPFRFDQSRQTTREILSYMVLPSSRDRKFDQSCLGWFVEEGGKSLARELGHCENKYKDSVRYIYYANEIIENNIAAIMKTAFSVCDAVRAPDFIEEQSKLLVTSDAIKSESKTHSSLNRESGDSLRVKFANLILEQLRRNGFQDKGKVERINKERERDGKERFIVNVASLRKKSDRIPVFKTYDLTGDYPPTIYLRH